ncbi:ADP-ribose glycohydrolase OARD1 isoform X2 [Nematostella vectensis]|nr:ADP-ribose glycohydrolase OARD1 isoform X2 [Nematostella vectensis]
MALSDKGEAAYENTRVKEVKGDLFTSPPNESLAHCISADIKMGKGIAVLFKKKFGGVDELHKQAQKPGGLAVLKRGPRFIYYLVTKEKFWQKPTYETLQQSLVAMSNHAMEHAVTDISMPMIGCGLDQLQWSRVLNIIKDVFKTSGIFITIYRL